MKKNLSTPEKKKMRRRHKKKKKRGGGGGEEGGNVDVKGEWGVERGRRGGNNRMLDGDSLLTLLFSEFDARYQITGLYHV